MNFEVARLAQKLKLTKAQLANPKVTALLEQFLEDEKVMLPEPPQLPKRPGAITKGTYGAYVTSITKEK